MINNLQVNPLQEVIPCDACHARKLSVKSFKQRHNITTTKSGQWTHTDLWGLSSTTSIGGTKYYLLCVDDYSYYVTIVHLKSKDQAVRTIKQYLTFLKNQYAFQLRTLHMDNGKEYVNVELIDWCQDNGICLELTAPYSPQQNGVAEHANRTLVELMWTMLSAQNLPFHLWTTAVSHAAYLHNRAYTKAIPNAIPYERWFGKKPSVNHLVEYGAPVWILCQPMIQSKLVPKALKHRFVRFEDSISTIHYWDQWMNTIKTSRNYSFAQYEGEDSDSDDILTPENIAEPKPENITNPKPEKTNPIPDTPENIAVQKKHIADKDSKKRKIVESTLCRTKCPHVVHDYSRLNKPVILEELAALVQDEMSEALYMQNELVLITNESDIPSENPKTLVEARQTPDWSEWENTIKAELKQLHDMGTWRLVVPPRDRKLIGNKWVFIKKYNKDGVLTKYKARLVAKGYSQIPRMDYNETYAPVVHLETLRSLIAESI